jgi:hypothetical protein
MGIRINTNTGIPVYLNDSDTPDFYIDLSDNEKLEKIFNLKNKVEDIEEKLKKKKEGLELDEDGLPKDGEKLIELLNDEYDEILKISEDIIGEEGTKKFFNGRRNQQLISMFLDLLFEAMIEYKKQQNERNEKQNKMKKYLKDKNTGVL